jgi:hypothetical protein
LIEVNGMSRKMLLGLLLVLSTLVSFTACSSDNGPSASRLVGTWNLVYFEEWETKNGEYDHQLEMDYTTIRNSMTVTFYEDGTTKTIEVYSDGHSTSNPNGTWAIKDSKFYWSRYGSYDRDDRYTIISLNKKTFIFEQSFTEYESGDKWQFYQKYTFERISDE